MFIVPVMAAIIFSLLTFVFVKAKEKAYDILSNNMITFLCSMLAMICWFIFGLTWPAVATDVLFVSVAYLWYAIGLIFAVFTLVVGIKMLQAVFNSDHPRLTIMEDKKQED